MTSKSSDFIAPVVSIFGGAQSLPVVKRSTAPKAALKKPAVPPNLRGFPARFEEAYQQLLQREPNVSLAELDRRAGESNGRAARIIREERLEKLAVTTIVSYARALGVSLDWLLTGKERSEPALRKHKGWITSLAVAVQRWGDELPEWVWDRTGDVRLPDNVKITPELVHECARLLHAHSGATILSLPPKRD